ncbi:queuosine 5'-phosphate N-glycosylase/hydrolase-like isoform X3 [Amphiura filiformis]
MTKETIDWIFVLDTLNFSFWTSSDIEPYLVHYKGKEHRGYWALCAVINRALDEGIPITSPSYYASMTLEQLQYVFRSYTSTPIPLLEQRLKHLHEAGKVLQEKFRGSFVNCIIQCNGSASELLKLITENFSSYRDTATYQNQTVSFYKRAQILIADIWACFEGQSYGSFTDINTLTMFADYRVPQVLNYLKAITYSDKLMELLRSGRELTQGERLEVEIRGCSIWTVELIRKELEELTAQDSAPKMLLNSIIIDFYLWDFATENWDDIQDIPIHRIRTQFY